MAITNFKFDVFLSYARADDGAVAGAKGWVTQLYEQLAVDLPAFLYGDAASVFFDKAVLGASAQLPELEDAARQSAVFLAISSPSYAKREWTNRELNAFTGAAPGDGRLFVVEAMPPDPLLAYPGAIATAIRRPFHAQTSTYRHDVIDPASEVFRREVRRLAMDIAAGLLAPRAAPPAATRPVAPAGRPCVLLAEPCADREEEAARLRLELRDIPVTVLPEAPYPAAAEAFRAAFAQDLRRADLFVQLLGPTRGWVPRGLPEGTTRYQAQAAMESGIEVLQWWPDHLDPVTLADTEHRASFDRDFVNASGRESLKRCTLENFRATVIRRLSAPKPVAPFMRPGAPPSPPPAPKLFIHHDLNPDDRELALRIQAHVPEGVFEDWSLPMITWSEEQGRRVPVHYDVRDAREKMQSCTTLVLVNGNTTANWVGGQIKAFVKLKGNMPARVVEVIVAPPEKHPSDDHGQRKSWLKRIPVRAPLDGETLAPVIDQLRP
jgi:hypothetical protein